MAEEPVEFRARVRPQRSEPFYESNSFQGWLAATIGIVLTVVSMFSKAIVAHWLLGFAWVCGTITLWKASSIIGHQGGRRVGAFVVSLLTAVCLIALDWNIVPRAPLQVAGAKSIPIPLPVPTPIPAPAVPQPSPQKKNEDLQAETFRELKLVIQPPPEGHNVLDTGFTITNNGQSSIGKHSILCVAYQLVGGTNVGRLIYGQEGGSDAPIQGGGDSQTDFCLARINQLRAYANVDCIDLLVAFNYSLEIQPNLKHGKTFRFWGVGGKSKGLTWYPERVVDSDFFCTALIEKIMHQP